MRMPGSLIAAIAAFGFAGLSIGPALAGTHERSAMDALVSTTTSMNEAVAAAEKQTGGVPVDAVFKEEGGSGQAEFGVRSRPLGKLTYTVNSVKDGTLIQTKVDGLTGEVTPSKPIPQSQLTADDQAAIAAAQQKPKISLQQATAAAEEKARGRAIQSSLTTKNGAPAYQVDVVMEAGAVTEVIVDPASGTVIVK